MNAVVLRKIFGLYFAFLIFLGRLRAQRDAILTAAGRVQGPDASLSEERQCSVACGRVPVRSRGPLPKFSCKLKADPGIVLTRHGPTDFVFERQFSRRAVAKKL